MLGAVVCVAGITTHVRARHAEPGQTALSFGITAWGQAEAFLHHA